MPFTREQKRVPTGIGRVGVEFSTMTAADTSVDATSAISIAVLDASGALMATRSYPLLANSTAGERNALYTFMKRLRAKAESEMLPPPEPVVIP